MSHDNPDRRSLFSIVKGLLRRSTAAAPGPAGGAPEDLWADRQRQVVITAANHDEMLQFARKTPLTYGYWGDLKQLYKEAERTRSLDILGALAARLDTVAFSAAPAAVTSSPATDMTTIHRIALTGTHAYLLTGTSRNFIGLHVFDISDPLLPTPLSALNVHQYAWKTDIALVGTHAVIVESRKALHVIDIAWPEQPRRLARIEMQDVACVAAMGSYAVVLTGERRGQLIVLDLTDPQRPVTLCRIPAEWSNALRVYRQRAYVLSGRDSRTQTLTVYDLQDITQPRRTDSLEVGGATAFEVKGDHAYVVVKQYGQESMLSVYDLVRKLRVGFLKLDEPRDIAIQGDYAYVGSSTRRSTAGLRIVKIADPARPRLAGSVPTDNANSIALQGSYAYFGEAPGWQAAVMRVAEISDPVRPILIGLLPPRATLSYMKRRARRALHALAESEPSAYVDFAARLLLETCHGKTEIDTAHQWITMDLLYGHSQRYQQAAHGRGSYLLRPRRLSLRSRDERYPELWDRQPQRVTSLYTDPDLPWQIHEAALKMLRGMGAPLPEPADAVLERFLHSPSALLATIAARAVAARTAQGQSVSGTLAAAAFYRGSGRVRRAIGSYAAQRAVAGPQWIVSFTERLYRLVSEEMTEDRLSRRQSSTLAYLTAVQPDLLARQIRPDIAVRLYATRRADLSSWALRAMETAAASEIGQWLTALHSLTVDLRDAAVPHLLIAARIHAYEGRVLSALVNDMFAWIRETAWRLAAASATAPAEVTRVWDGLLQSAQLTDSLRTAMASPPAIALFQRLALDGRRMADLLRERPFLIGLFPPDALRSVLRALSSEATLTLVEEADETQWPGLRSALLAEIDDPARRASLWQAAWQRIDRAGTPILVARLLADPALASTFLRIENVDYLETGNPVFAQILADWVRAHEPLFGRDSPALLRISTHMLPEIRDFGLSRARALGMSLSFALRLLESELPAAVALGRMFFDSVPMGDDRELEYAAALCDSPQATVRAYGRDYTEARWASLPKGALYARLTESPDAAMQAYLAGKMLATGDRFAQAPVFDRQVLRGRRQARRAKELVKRRLDSEPTQDIALLLEMARGRTPRDAEWALSQLARLALDGVAIEGFTLDGAGVSDS